jgi:Chalcone isomerase-like
MVLLLASEPALGETKPMELANVIKAEQPYGHGALSRLMITAYDADLWTDALRWSMQTPSALTLRYRMGFSTDEIVSRSLKEMKRDDPAVSEATLAQYRKLMIGIFPSVKAGDEITGLYTPTGTTQVFLNGRQTGQVHDATFAQRFFGIWLSPSTSEPGLRDRLLRLR